MDYFYMKKTKFIVCVILFSLTTSCSDMLTDALDDSSVQYYLYVAGSNTNKIQGFSIDNDGSLNPLQIIDTMKSPLLLKSHPTGNILYSVHYNSFDMSFFYIRPGGTLEYYGSIETVSNACGFCIDPEGIYAYSMNATDIDEFALNYPQKPTFSKRDGGSGADYYCVVHPSGNYLYTTSPALYSYTINRANGGILPKNNVSTNNPYRLVIHPSGSFLYTGENASPSVRAFNINIDGSIGSKIGDYNDGAFAMEPGAGFER